MTKRTVKPVEPPTRFANLSDAKLADEFGAIETEHDALKARQDEAREELTRRRKWAIEGQAFTVLKAVTATSSLDTGAIRKEMGEAWVSARTKPGTRTTYRVAKKGEVCEPTPPKRSRNAGTLAR